MPGSIEFRYDAAQDIVVAIPRWTICNQQDCEAWFAEWSAYFSKFKRKMDCVVLLDQFHVETAIAAKWGELRAKLNNDYFRHSYRVHPTETVRLFTRTSGVRFNAATGEAPTVEDAIAGILDARQKPGV